ncbi:hypothetical protein Tco_1238946 [Tanacetum coccineum]
MSVKYLTYVNLTSLSGEQPNERTHSPPSKKKSLSPLQAPSKSISSKSTHYTSSSSPSESPTPTHVAPPPKLHFVIPIKQEPQELPPLQMSPNNPYVSTMDNWPHGPSNPYPPPCVSRPPPDLNHYHQPNHYSAKFVRDYKSLAKEANESLEKIKVLEQENKRLLKAVKIKWLQAQLGDLKGKSMDTQYALKSLDSLSQKLKDENVSLELQKHKANVKKTKKLGSKESLASPMTCKPRTHFRWLPIGRTFDLSGKSLDKSNTKAKNEIFACDNANLEVAFKRNIYFVRNIDGVDLLKGNRSTNLYTINLLEMTSTSRILELTYAPSTITPDKPTEQDLELLFKSIYNDYMCGQLLDATRTALAAPTTLNHQTPNASTTITETTPTPTNSSTEAPAILNTSQDVDELQLQKHFQQLLEQTKLQSKAVVDNANNAHFDDNTFINLFASPSTILAESSSQYVDPSNMHMLYQLS